MLTESQILHNRMVDFEIEQAEREFQQREQKAKELGEAFHKAYPNSPFKSNPYMNVIGKRKVIAIRYVE